MPFSRCLFLLIIPVFFALQACKSNNEEILRVPSLHPLKATGLNLTDAMGNPIATWGNPIDKPSATIGTCKIGMMAYPNPFRSSLVLHIEPRSYAPNCEENVTIFAVPIGADSDQSNTYAASAVLAETGVIPSLILIKDKPMPLYSTWQFQLNLQGQPAGFYRIYVKINSQYMWIDTFHATDCATTPSSLVPFVYLNCN